MIYITQQLDEGDSEVGWKHLFIKYDLLNKEVDGLKFKNGFEPDAWKENGYSYTAVYTNEQKRTDSGELYSFVLAWLLKESGKTIRYCTSQKEEYCDENNFPYRYFIISEGGNETQIGFKDGKFIKRNGEEYHDEISDIIIGATNH